MLQITAPSSLETVRRYIVHVLLDEFLGLPYRMVVHDSAEDVRIHHGDRVLTVADRFLPGASEAWLRSESLPRQPLPKWQVTRDLNEIPLVEPELPVISGKPALEDQYLEVHEGGLKLHLDVFGSSFFMLSRYEEAVRPDRDGHDRFPACGSLAYQEGFLTRPIVNEYVEVLWACLKRLWPRLERKKREFRVIPSHDVDRPFAYAFRSPYRIARNLAGDVLKRHAPVRAVRNLIHTVRVQTSRPDLDPCNNFDWIMDVSESEGLVSAFYFIADRNAAPYDADYSITHHLIRRLLRRIHDRGHEIGLHASYSTYQDRAQTASEFEALKAACSAEGIRQEAWGSRQHYLRWDTSRTFGNLNTAGLDYDTTLSFADVAGFRCGTCYEYPSFDLQKRMALHLRERPLIVMECTVTDEPYMNLGKGDAALEHMLGLKRACRQFGGDFTLLWHNSSLLSQHDIALYQAILQG